MNIKTLCEKCKSYWTNTYLDRDTEYDQLFCEKTPNYLLMNESVDGKMKPTIIKCDKFESKEKVK